MRFATLLLAAAAAAAGCEAPSEAPDGPAPVDPCDVGRACIVAGVPEFGGYNGDGLVAVESWLYRPHDVAPAPDGSFYFADGNNHVIRRVDLDGIATVVAGSGFPDFGDGGPARAEPLHDPSAVVIDPRHPSTLWLGLPSLQKVGRVRHGRVRYPYGTGEAWFSGDGGDASRAAFDRPSSLAFDDEGSLYVSDRMNHVVRKIDRDGIITTVIGQPGTPGYDGDGGPADLALIRTVVDGSRDPANGIDIVGARLVLADTGNDALREVDLETNVIRTLVRRLRHPHDVAIGPDGAVLFSDTDRYCVKVLHPDGEIETVLGVCGTSGVAVHGELATETLLAFPAGVAWGVDGSIWVADTYTHVIVRVAR